MPDSRKAEHFSDDPEMDEFCNDLLHGVKEAKAGIAARSTVVEVSRVTAVRNKTGLTQKEFASLLGVSVRTLQSWECGARNPSGAARTVLRIAERNPKILAELAADPG